MPPKRRTNASSPAADDANGTASRDLKKTTAKVLDNTKAQIMHSPFLPTPAEAALLAIYPVTLLLGSLFSHFSPSLKPPANLSTYSPLHQSFQPSSLAPSYWATKRNVFNVYFVKLGWFWCTVALLLFTLLAARGRSAIDIGLRVRRDDSAAPPAPKKPARLADMDATSARAERDDRLRRQYQVLLRYALTTAAWVSATQWFLGAPLIDRVFRLSGGACHLLDEEAHAADEPTLRRLAEAASYPACKAARGRWAGGVDISGHVFLLVLGSGMLALETLPLILPWARGLTVGRVVRGGAGGAEAVRVASLPAGAGGVLAWHGPAATGGVETRARRAADEASQRRVGVHLKSWGVTAALGFVGLSWWMLLMTAAFFHTWVEKSVACVLAGVALWAVYFAPRGTVALRDFVGMPGV